MMPLENMTVWDPTTVTMHANDTDLSWMLNITGQPEIITPRPWNILEKSIFATWIVISMVLSLVGNLMVIIVVWRHKGMQTRTNMFLVNLAIADLLTGLLLMPFSLTTLINDRWVFGDTMCKINGFFNSVCLICSIHTMMYISIHKYVSITRPFSRILNHWKILIMCLAAWIWSITCAILTLFILSHVVIKPGAMQCGPVYPISKTEKLHHVIISGTNILLPLAVMLYAYAKMYIEFRKHAVRLRKNSTLQSDQILGQQIQVTKTLFIVLACFFICWIPYAVYSSYVSEIKDKNQILVWTNPLAYCFMFMNSGFNPIIYGWRSNSFREGYKQILCQKSTYLVSDVLFMEMLMFNVKRPSDSSTADTIRDSNSPSIIRRLSTLLHASFRSTVGSRKGSEHSSVTSVYRPHTPSPASPTHTLLRRATSKTARGSSIIRKDGSLIITKNGKIISVRRDVDSIKRDRSFSGFDDLKITNTKPASRSLSEINCINKDVSELKLLLENRNEPVHHFRSEFLSPHMNASTKNGHTSLSKIDSVDETNFDSSHAHALQTGGNVMDSGGRTLSVKSRECTPSVKSRECTLSVNLSPDTNRLSASSDNVFITDEEETALVDRKDKDFDREDKDFLCVNSFRDRQYLSRSDNMLDQKSSPQKKKTGITKSSDVIVAVPLLRGPSIERLDTAANIPRCSSDDGLFGKKLPARSPLYVRRWLSNKNIFNTKVKSKT